MIAGHTKWYILLYFLQNKLMRLYLKPASSYAPIFQCAPIFEQLKPPVTFRRLNLWSYLAHLFGSPIKMLAISYAIGMCAYFPTQMEWKSHMRLFLMGAYYWVLAYFPRNTVLDLMGI